MTEVVRLPIRLYGLRDIAKFYRKKKATIREWIKLGAPIIWNGTSWQVSDLDLDRWLLSQKNPVSQKPVK